MPTTVEAQRSHRRFPIRAPVKLATSPHVFQIKYSEGFDFVEDYIENLSQGGAFVRAAIPLPIGTEVILEMELPDETVLNAKAHVMHVQNGGMGLQFVLDSNTSQILASVVARLGVLPKKALIIDDDVFMRKVLGDALAEQGFTVSTASDGKDGLRTLFEELLSIDIVVVDLNMPNMDSQQLIHMIRRVGNETDLSIVMGLSGFLCKRLERVVYVI